MDAGALGALFVVALLLNLVWEFSHVHLYLTKVSNAYLVWQSVKDAVWVTLAYLLAPNIYVFAGGLVVFAFLVEFHAIKTKRWEYAHTMPRIAGVGLSPLLELVTTGLISVSLVILGS